MKYFPLLLVFCFQVVQAQKIKKADKVTLANLKTHISYLADDKLEGRRTGTHGEKLAYEYISSEFKKNGLEPKGDNKTYLQEFEVNDGRFVDPTSHLVINGNDLLIQTDYFPLPFCPNKSFEAISALALQESGGPWFYDLKELIESNINNPHFDLTDAIKDKANALRKKGAGALFVYNSSKTDDGLKFEAKSKEPAIDIPVLYISKEIKNKYLKDETATLDIKLKILVEEKKRFGHNVVGFIDNKAVNTIILGAHYDHLGYGEDHNSMYTGKDSAIHNGADDNASGTAALIEMSRLLPGSKYKKYNYLFIAFSGEELGLYGSKYFTEHSFLDLSKIDYMINMDMVGRLSDSSHAITIGGYGTSPSWGELIPQKDKYFVIKIDSSGTGPSDHTSFYRKDIPVLFFFTGLHKDYHKPSDDADKINYVGELLVLNYIYNIIAETDKINKIAFTKTREVSTGRSNFKVTLGIMPDYTFNGSGLRVDGVSEGKIAQKAGIKVGDVLQQLGDYKFTDVQTYMEALGKFKKGDPAKLKLKRGNEEMTIDIIF